MKRVDQLYALAEELRARAPHPVTPRELAHRFEVSPRTIEQDLLALQEAGCPSGPGLALGAAARSIRSPLCRWRVPHRTTA